MTMTKKYIEDKDGNRVLPITHLSAVKDSNGNTLEDILWEEQAYDPTHYSGMGKVVLQKNMVSDVNTLTQAMLAQTNTIYVIRYDFTLGEDITIPANCILEFDGGSISASGSNDTITGQNTEIKANLVKIFNTDTTLSGSWSIVEAYPEWFGAKGDGVTDDTVALQKTLNIGGGKIISFKEGSVYAVSSMLTASQDGYIKGNSATLKAISDYSAILANANNVEGLTIDGNNHQNQYGILITSTSKDGYIKNNIVRNIKNDTTNTAGIFINSSDYSCHITIEGNLIENIYSKDNGIVGDNPGSAVGIASYSEQNLTVRNNRIHGIKVSDDGYGIYIAKRTETHNVEVSGNIIYDVYNTGIKSHMPSIVISNNSIDMNPATNNDVKMGYGIRLYTEDAMVISNTITFDDMIPMYGIFLDTNSKNNYIGHNTFNAPHSTYYIHIKGYGYNIVEGHSINSDTTPSNPLYSCITIESNNNIIRNNNITAEAWAIGVAGEGNIIEDNYIDANGINIGYNTNVSITHNDLKDSPINISTAVTGASIVGNKLSGIVAAVSASFKHKDVTIKDNVFSDNSLESSTIQMWYCDSITIADNVFKRNNTTYQEIASSYMTNMKITGNTFVTSLKPFRVVNTQKLIVTNNIAPENAVIETTGSSSVIIDNNININS